MLFVLRDVFRTLSNRTTPEPAVKVSLTLLCSFKLWIWSLSSVIHETLTVTLLLRMWKLTTYIESSEWLNIGTWLCDTKFGQRIQNHFSGKARLTLKLSKKFLPILDLPLNLSKSKSNLRNDATLLQGSKMYNLVNKVESHFSENEAKHWKFFLILEFLINLFLNFSKRVNRIF